MNILIIGNGGREHALALKISQSPRCIQLYIAPGNPGTAQCGTNVDLNIKDHEAVKLFCLTSDIDLIVVGPEVPLVDGFVDNIKSGDTAHICVVGPSQKGAQLEGSKAFAKAFMQKYDIPTASFMEVTNSNIDAGYQMLSKMNPPYVLKADGLAAGKGVLILHDLEEAKNALSEMIDGKFGEASAKVVIEEFLAGIEFSMFALTDGKDYVLLPSAKDYKRVGDGDTGLNTGGMGAISPVPFLDDELLQKAVSKIIHPTMEGLKSDNLNYIGFVFFGLIKVGGEPFVIEYNCRLGDPETEAILPRIESDLVELFDLATTERISEYVMKINPAHAATIVLVSGGYPEEFAKGYEIKGIEEVEQAIVYQSGTKLIDNKVVTNGGRVLAITGMGSTQNDALERTIAAISKIEYQSKYHRTDIGKDLEKYYAK